MTETLRRRWAMQTIRALEKTGKDGTLLLRIPLGVPETEYEVLVVELRYGCLRSARPAANLAAVQALLAPYVSLPFDDAAAELFAAIRRHLEVLGTTIGPYDLQIAAIALANGCTLVTHNQAEF